MEKHFRPYADRLVKNYGLLKDALSYVEYMKLKGGKWRPGFAFRMIAMGCGELLDLAKCLSLPVTTSSCQTAKILTDCGENETSLELLLPKVAAIVEALEVELSAVNFLAISQESNQFIDSDFGKAVAVAFADSRDDIDEVFKCFVCGRFTASMFHLGRVMELATKRFGKKIKAATPGKDEWQRWLTAINEKIKLMPWGAPKEKDKREQLTEIAAHFFNFKESFRNKTMHPEKSYTKEQSLDAIRGAQAFLDTLARRVFKVKVT